MTSIALNRRDLAHTLQALIDDGSFGIGYWASSVQWRETPSGTVVDVVDVDGKAHVVDVDVMLLGLERTLERLIDGKLSLRSDYAVGMLSGGLAACDADGIDCLVQLGLFNSIVYG